jgi:DNA-binding response OmpR family regulator
MRILILGHDGQDLTTLEGAMGQGDIVFRPAGSEALTDRVHVFAEWTLDETARDLVSLAGRRVDLTSSEFDLLMTFVRQPGQALSRNVLLGALRGRAWTYFDRSIDTLVARLRKKLEDGPRRPPLIRSVRGVGYVFCAAVSRARDAGRLAAT